MYRAFAFHRAWGYTVGTFGIIPRPRQQWRGIFLLYVEGTEPALDAGVVLIVQSAEPRRETAVINRPRLVEARDHIAFPLAELHVPRTFVDLGGSRDNKIKAVCQLLENDNGPREKVALAVYLRTDILADARPPNVALRHQGRLARDIVQPLLESYPL